MVHLLLDTESGYPFIANKLGIPHVKHVSRAYNSKLRTWYNGSRSVLENSKHGDMIVCVLDIQAVMCYLLCCLTFRSRKILAINLLLKHKPTLRNKVAAGLYKLALRSHNFRATVTSPRYGEWLNEKHGMRHRYYHLPDVYYNGYGVAGNIGRGDYVFCGGRNGRDWRFMLAVAKNMPDIAFKLVVPGTVRHSLEVEAGENVEIISDVPMSRFLEIMDESAMVCCPLDTQAPAGLIVMFQGAGHDKVIVSTDTVVSQAYINEERGYLLPNEVDSWTQAIRDVLCMGDTEYYTMCKKMKSFLEAECNEDRFVSQLRSYIT